MAAVAVAVLVNDVCHCAADRVISSAIRVFWQYAVTVTIAVLVIDVCHCPADRVITTTIRVFWQYVLP